MTVDNIHERNIAKIDSVDYLENEYFLSLGHIVAPLGGFDGIFDASQDINRVPPDWIGQLIADGPSSSLAGFDGVFDASLAFRFGALAILLAIRRVHPG